MDGGCECEVVGEPGLVLHRQIALGVGRGGTDDADIQRERAVEQPLLPCELDDLRDGATGGGVEPTTIHARVNERSEADLRDQARAMPGDLAVEQGERSPGDAEGLHLVGRDHAHDLRVVPVVGADEPSYQTRAGQSPHAPCGVVTDAHGVDHRQARRFARRVEAGGERGEDSIGDLQQVAAAPDRHGLPG